MKIDNYVIPLHIRLVFEHDTGVKIAGAANAEEEVSHGAEIKIVDLSAFPLRDTVHRENLARGAFEGVGVASRIKSSE